MNNNPMNNDPMNNNPIGVNNNFNDKLVLDGEIKTEKNKNKEDTNVFNILNIFFRMKYYIPIIISLMIIRIKLLLNEYNYLKNDKEVNILIYLLLRFICGRFCLFKPVMNVNSIYFKIYNKLAMFGVIILILYILVIPFTTMKLFNFLVENTDKSKKKLYIYKSKLYKIIKNVINLLIIVLLIATILI